MHDHHTKFQNMRPNRFSVIVFQKKSSNLPRFENRLISLKCAIELAAHSPDLNHPEFYLWGYLHGSVYVNNPQTIQELKTAVVQTISKRNTERMCESHRQFRECRQSQGPHK